MPHRLSIQSKKTYKVSKTATCIAALLGAWSASQTNAQEAMREMLAARPMQNAPFLEDQPATFKLQDLRVLVTPSFGISYNDNIGISEGGGSDDFILSPLVSTTGYYPITDRNVLTFNIGVGYDQYLKHSDYSGLHLSSGSGTEFNMGIRDFQINLHERFSYTKEASSRTELAGNGKYGIVNNTTGILTTWDLGDITPSIGYDHKNTMSPSGTAQEYQSQDSSSELLVGRVGVRVRPDLLAGIEATGSFTKYDQRVLNNNSSYSIGPYAELQIGDLSIQPRAGYSAYQFDHTSSSIQTASSGSWYADIAASYKITKVIGASLTLGHQTSTGIQSDAVETYYATSGMSWAIIEGGNLNFRLAYVNGKQGVGNKSGNLTESYDSVSPSIGFRYQITKRLSGSLDYRLTIRTSDRNARDYTQNLVSLVLRYPLY